MPFSGGYSPIYTVITNPQVGDHIEYDGTKWVNAVGGVDAHALLSAVHTDVVAQAVTRGSIIYGNASPAWDELVIGASGNYLRSDGTDISWSSILATDVPDGADATAIHDNVAAEISAITEKVTPIGADLILIEDSADSNNKKKIQVGYFKELIYVTIALNH